MSRQKKEPKKQPKKQSSFPLAVLVTTLKMFLILIVLIFFAGFGAALGVGKAYLDSTPELDISRIENQSQTSFIYDKDGKLITEYFGFENRVWAPLNEIPDALKDAVISTEDVRFYKHHGLDYKRLAGAFINNLKNESIQGGSTITQQLIKLSMLTPERTYKRKIQEAYLALQLEKKYSKDQILEAYLNIIPLGQSNYGVKAAAKDYFGKELKDLTLRECAVLAGLTQNPSKYDPRRNLTPVEKGGRAKPEWTYKRANTVLKRMYQNGRISEEEYNKAKFDENNTSLDNSQLAIKEKSENRGMYSMPYFIEYAIYDVRDKLMIQNGWKGDEGRKKAEKMIYAGGLKIYTTVDAEMQKKVEDAVYNYENLPKFANAKDNVSSQGVPQPQIAAVVIDQHTGELRAIVGGKQPPVGRRELNRAFMSKLPLGSSIKPLAVYGPFIEAGYPGGIIFENIPIKIDGWNSKRGYPDNYEGGGYTGPTDVRTGIRKSLNIVAGKIVAEPNRLGPQYSANKLVEMGIDSNDIPGYPDDPSPAALALGTHGNNMVEVVAAYASIANNGVYQEPISFTRVLDKDNNEILNTSSQIKRVVFKESTAFILTDWMEDAVQHGTGTRARFKFPMHIAGKTGTNDSYRGVYFAGFTPYYTASVWIGHDDFRPSFRKGSSGSVYAAPLWRAIMEPIHEGLESKPFYDSVPDDVVKVTVCGISGMLPNGDLCKDHLVTEYFPKDAVPKEVCNWHKNLTVCSVSGKLPTPYCPEENIVSKPVIVLPKDSPYRQLSDEQLQKYIPGAFRDMINSDMLSYENEQDAQYFCPIHNKAWKDNENKNNSLIKQAQELIEKVKSEMKEKGDKISPQDKSRLQEMINQLEQNIKNAISPSSENGNQGDNPPPFDTNIIQNYINNLKNLSQSIFSKIEDNGNQDNSNNQNNDHQNNNGQNDADDIPPEQDEDHNGTPNDEVNIPNNRGIKNNKRNNKKGF